jgi:hypothetical protein
MCLRDPDLMVLVPKGAGRAHHPLDGAHLGGAGAPGEHAPEAARGGLAIGAHSVPPDNVLEAQVIRPRGAGGLLPGRAGRRRGRVHGGFYREAHGDVAGESAQGAWHDSGHWEDRDAVRGVGD